VVRPPAKDLRERLIVPVADELGSLRHADLVEGTLKKAAQQLADSKLFFRWDRRAMGAGFVLKYWSEADGMFLSFDGRDFCRFLGRVWRVVDTDGQEWSAPSIAIGARLYQALLEMDLPVADWKVTVERRASK
jgi:hypothetical protein